MLRCKKKRAENLMPQKDKSASIENSKNITATTEALLANQRALPFLISLAYTYTY